MKIAVVTGANGFVGSNLVRELVENGYTVRALHRKESDISTLDGLEIERYEADIRDPGSLTVPFQGADVVFHIAALFRQAKHADQVYHDINVTGTKNVLDTAIACGVKKVIHCSTVGVHSHIPHPPAAENEPYRPGDIYQESKCEGEKLALSYFTAGKIFGVVIRPAMIWGPGDTRTLKLFKGIAHKKFPLIGDGKTQLHWVLVTDLARAFRLAYEADLKSGEVFIIAGETTVPIRKLFNLISGEFNVRAPLFAYPALPFQLLGDLCELICKPFGIEPPIYRRRVDFFTKTRSFNIEKAKQLLTYKPAGTIEDEVQQIASWYKRMGWV